MADQKEIDAFVGENQEYITRAYYHAVDLSGKESDKFKALEEIQAQVKSDEKSIQTELRDFSKDDYYLLRSVLFPRNLFWNSFPYGNGTHHLL